MTAPVRRWQIYDAFDNPCLWDPMYREENARDECARLNEDPTRKGHPFRVVDTLAELQS